MNDKIKFFKDQGLTEEVEIFDLGIVDAGETQRYTFWVMNNTPGIFTKLSFSIDHDEVEIIKSPTDLVARGVEELILEWSPSVTLEEGLKVQIDIKGKVQFNPPL